MLISILAVVVGLVLLVWSADRVVEGASQAVNIISPEYRNFPQ
jgi:Ca2+/Na+ antiporter